MQNVKLSKNFSLKELTKSDTAARASITNEPTEDRIEALKNLCENVLQPVRDKLGRINVNSGYRCPELCTKIGSSKTSNHVFGYAADIEPADSDDNPVTNFECLTWIAENLEFKELIAEYFNVDDKDAGWIHVAYQEGNNKKVIKLKDKTNNYRVVTLGELKELYA
jgi:zinc D-Ala-D-Ala carboxypeptidase